MGDGRTRADSAVHMGTHAVTVQCVHTEGCVAVHHEQWHTQCTGHTQYTWCVHHEHTVHSMHSAHTMSTVHTAHTVHSTQLKHTHCPPFQSVHTHHSYSYQCTHRRCAPVVRPPLPPPQPRPAADLRGSRSALSPSQSPWPCPWSAGGRAVACPALRLSRAAVPPAVAAAAVPA